MRRHEPPGANDLGSWMRGEAGRDVSVDCDDEVDIGGNPPDLALDGEADRDDGRTERDRQGIVRVTHEVDYGAPQATGVGERADKGKSAGIARLAECFVYAKKQISLLVANTPPTLGGGVGTRGIVVG
jgi:hypothetical protein